MQQEMNDGTAALLQLKKELDQDCEVNSSPLNNENSINSQHVEIKEETDVKSEQLEKLTVEQLQEVALNSVPQLCEKNGANLNNQNAQAVEELNTPDQSKENENVGNEPDKTITNELEEIINKKLQAIVHNKSIQIAEAVNSNAKQPDVGEEINSNAKQPEVDEEINSNAKQPEVGEEINSNAKQPEVGEEINSNAKQPEVGEEINSNAKQPEVGEEINSNAKQPEVGEEINSNAKQPEVGEEINSNAKQPEVGEEINSNAKQPEVGEEINSNAKQPEVGEEINSNAKQPEVGEEINSNAKQPEVGEEINSNAKLPEVGEEINSNAKQPEVGEEINSNAKQPEVGEELNSNEQLHEENEKNQSHQNEEGENCILPQSNQQLQEDEASKELNYISEHPEMEKETADNPDQENVDSPPNLGGIEDDSEFEIIDIADYDPEFPTGDVENASLAKETEETTNGSATKRPGKKERLELAVLAQKKIKLTDAQKKKLLKNLERKIVRKKINPDNFPTPIWRSLKQVTGSERRAFVKLMKEKYAKRQLARETTSNKPPQMQGVINDLTNSLSQWFLEHWSTMEYSEGNPMERNTFNEPRNERQFTEAQKRKVMKNVEKMVDQNKVDLHNLPPRIWNSLKQLKSRERKKFLNAMKEKLAKRLDTRQPQAAGPSETFTTRSTPRNFTKSVKLPSHFQIQPAWNKNKEQMSGNLPSYSRDFHSQRFNERDTFNTATTSRVSPNAFSHYFQDGYPQSRSQEHTTTDRNSYEDYTEPPYRSFNDSFKTPKREDTFRRSSNSFSHHDQGFLEGVHRPSYPNSSSYQSQSYNSLGYANDMDYQSIDGGNTSRTMGKSPYDSRYAADLRRQASSFVNSRQNMYSNTKKTLKRKLSDNASTYGQPQPKRANMGPNKSFGNSNDGSIKAVIMDDNNPSRTMNEEQASLLSCKLVDLLDKVSLSSRGHIPRFHNSGLAEGVFKISCADPTSFNWLKQMVSNMPPLWSRAKLRVENWDTFSSKGVRVSVFIAGPLEDPEITLSRLERQNPGLKTGAWKVFKQQENTKGQILYLEIDKSSVQDLKRMDFKAFLGLSSVQIWVLDNARKNRKAFNR